jgi:NhaP-type Na+/H+ or K+/H+ antiporter
MFFVCLFLLMMLFSTAAAAEDNSTHHEEGVEPAFAVLFPWFIQAVGICVFFIQTRTFHALPYTALLFLIGTVMGIGAAESGLADQLTESILLWTDINSEVLLVVFLPGLLFRDAFHVNFYLFTEAMDQLLIMAFLMVLAGTALTALVAYYVLPYNWSFNLAMTFGSILAATDPVAVASLLNEVGAPPRLKMHIAGESMLVRTYVVNSIWSLDDAVCLLQTVREI